MGKFYYDICYGKRYRGYRLPSAEKAEMLLHSLSPDPKSSSIREKKSSLDLVDLQIIVPVYNVEKFVVNCIDSILNQNTTYKYKIIIINDGSPDGSRALLKKYESDPKVEIIDQENRGFSGARNAGLSQLIGKYVMFVDSDDYITPDAIQLLMDMAYETDADIVQGGYYEIKGNDINIGYIPHCKGLTENKTILGFPWAKVYKSWLWDGIGFPEGYWFEDTINVVLFMNMAQKIAMVNRPIYYYYTNPKGISKKAVGKPKAIDSFYVTRMLIDDSHKLGLFDHKDTSQALLDVFCSQAMIAAIRTVRLDIDVQRALFVATIDVFYKYFDPSAIPSTSLYKELVNSLKAKDFAKYLRICLLRKL